MRYLMLLLVFGCASNQVESQDAFKARMAQKAESDQRFICEVMPTEYCFNHYPDLREAHEKQVDANVRRIRELKCQ